MISLSKFHESSLFRDRRARSRLVKDSLMSSETPTCGYATPASLNSALRKGLPFSWVILDEIGRDDGA